MVPEIIKKFDPVTRQLDGVTAYHKNRENGMKPVDALEKTGIRGGRQIERYQSELKKLGRRIREGDP